MTQAVVDRLVDEERVEHEPTGAQARLQRDRHRFGGGAPHVAVGRHEQREAFLEAHRAGVEVDRDRRGELGEEPHPRAAGGERLVGEDDLLRLAQQVRPVPAGGLEVVAAERELLVGEELGGAVVVDRGPFELDEDELVVDRGGLLLGARDQRAVRRVGGVDGEAQARVRVGATDEIADRGELVHELGEAGGVELGDAAAVLGDLTRLRVGFGEERVDARFRLAVDERLDVPRDVGRGPVSFRDGHAVKASAPRGTVESPRASGSGSECTTTR